MLIRHTLLYLPAQLLGPLTQFIAAVVWTHWMAPDAYGVLTYVMAAQELLYLVSLSWWAQFTLRYLSRYDAARESDVYLRAEGAVLSAAAVVQSLGAVAILFVVDQHPSLGLMASAIFFSLTRSLTMHLGERARARAQIAYYTVAQTAGPVAGFVLAYALAVYGSASPAAALAGYGAAQALALAWLWIKLSVTIDFRRPERPVIEKALRFGAPLIAAGGIAWVSLNAIRVVVEHLGSADALGLLSVGWGLGHRLANTVAMLVTAAAFPLAVKRLQEGSRADALDQLGLSGALLFGCVAPATVGVMLVAPQLVDLIIAAPFRAATLSVLPLAALAGGVRNMRIHFSDQALLLFERTKLGIGLNGAEAVLAIVGSIVGFQLDGVVGATAGALAAIIVAAMLGFVMTAAYFGLRPPFRHIARIALATAAMGLSLKLGGVSAIGGPVMGLCLAIAQGVVVYALALSALYPTETRMGMARLRALASARR